MLLPSIENLRCFDAATRSASFRAAARLVGLTPAALGARIRQLEEQLGTPLFVRTTRSMALSPAGHALVPVAREALEAAAQCVRAARGDVGTNPVEATIGASYDLGLSFLLPMHEALVARHPGLALHYRFGHPAEMLARLRARELDAALAAGPVTDSQLDAALLHREDYAFVGASQLVERFPLRKEADARVHTLVDLSPELPLFERWRTAPGGGDRLQFASIWRVGALEAVRRIVLAGHGVAVVPVHLVKKELANGRVKRLFPKVTPQPEQLRLFFLAGDARKPVFEGIAAALRKEPLQ